MTLQTRLVLAVLLAEPGTEFYGRQLAATTGLPAATTYPILAAWPGPAG